MRLSVVRRLAFLFGFACLGAGLLSASPAHAQSGGGGGSSAPSLRRPSGERVQLGPDRRRTARRSPLRTDAAAGKAIGGITELGPSQSFVRNATPLSRLNIDLTGTPRYAGDVNGDGVKDYLYSAQGRDERTQALEDRTGKTYVYFGGTPSTAEAQFFYTRLYPAGDLNDDGFADALQFNNGSVSIYEGTSTGYQDSGVSLNISGGRQVRGFTDLDGDGIEDVLIASSGTDAFSVVYGAASLTETSVQTYQPNTPAPPIFQHNVSDLDGTGSGSIVRLAGEFEPGVDTIRVSVINISTVRELTVTQSFQAGELDGRATANQLSLIDIDGAGQREIVTTTGIDAPSYYFSASAGIYNTTPDSLGKDDAVPVGDLDGDGRHDFYTFDDNTDTRYISYGPSALGTDLTFDTPSPYPTGAVGRAGYVPQDSLGDIDGDGRPDAVLDYDDPTAEAAGRRFFSVDPDRTGRTPTDVTYPEGTFFDALPAANNVGDVNGDGTPDFAVVRSSLNQVELYFGGVSLESQPDLIFEAPTDSTVYFSVSGGDFNGDGAADLAMGYNDGRQVDVYLGGDNLDATVDRVLDPADFGLEGIYFPRFIGDVNDDGVEDLFVSDFSFFPNAQSSAENFAVFFGDSPLPSTPDRTVGYPSFGNIGRGLAAPGDLNGDGIDDFVVGRPAFDDGSNSTGRADVYFGGSNPSFDSPDLIIRPPDLTENVNNFSSPMAGGDFTGDGNPDLAIPSSGSDTEVGISIFEGGAAFDDARDQSLPVPADSRVGFDVNEDGFSETLRGVLSTAGDVDRDGADELLLTSGTNSTNALLYSPSTQTDPIRVLRAPNQSAGLGARFSFGAIAAGDFLANGASDLILTQYLDNNDASLSSRLYRYAFDLEVPAASVPTDGLSDTLALGTTAPQSLDIENTAGSASENLAYELLPRSGGSAVDWLDAPEPTGTVAPGATESAALSFSARSNGPGTYTGTLRIATNDPVQDTIDVPVSLTVTSPPVAISSPDAPLTPGTEAALDLTFPAGFAPFSATLFYRIPGTFPFASSAVSVPDVDPSTETTVTAQLPDSVVTDQGVQVYVQAVGPLPDGSGNTLITAPADAPGRTAFVPADLGTVAAEGAFAPATYRMVTVPVGLGERSVFDVLEQQYGSYAPGTWRLARWAPADSSYRFGPAVDSLRPGEAAWLITAGGDSLTVPNAQSPPAPGPQPLTLGPGWNQIGSPFAFPVRWAAVQRPDAVRAPVSYDASRPAGDRFQFQADTLRPWQGAFVYNEAPEPVTIRVPPLDASQAPTPSAAPDAARARAAAPGDGYRLQAIATLYRNDTRLQDRSTWLGFAEAARSGFGPLDLAKPPRVGDHVRLQVDAPDGPALARSLKPPTTQGAVWDLTVGLHVGDELQSKQTVTVQLLEQAPRPDGFELYVLDRQRERRLPVTNGSVTVPLTPDRPERTLRVIVGTEAFAEAKSDGTPLTIEETKLRANAPNPFTNATTIAYQLAESQDVTVAVYDLLGRRVQTLVDGSREQGVHQIEWRAQTPAGQPLASGVYFLRMRAGSYTGSQKMVVVR